MSSLNDGGGHEGGKRFILTLEITPPPNIWKPTRTNDFRNTFPKRPTKKTAQVMRAFALGSNGSGQLAIGHTEDVSAPTECLFECTTPTDKFMNIVAGGNHTLLLTESGHVYAAGCNTDGRCGPIIHEIQGRDSNGNQQVEENILRFRQVILTDHNTANVFDKFKCISATWEGSIFVSSVNDQVFVLGSTPKGELGLGRDIVTTTQVAESGAVLPDFPPAGTSVVSLASGMGHTVAVLSTGEVYGWGGSRKGQLGDSLKAEKIVWTPVKIEGIPFHATDAVCGREFTVILGQKDLGEFFVLGDSGNRWGIMNIPASLQYFSKEGGRKQYLDIGASWHGIYVLTTELDSEKVPNSSPKSLTNNAAGSLVAWGRNDRGQLPPANMPHVLEIGVGSEHILALLENGSVATFGWGEHGNCGPDTDARGNVAGEFKILSSSGDGPGERVVGVSAGCATSWLIVE